MTLFSGIGTEADSLTSCGGLEPRPPQRDFFKFMQKDREGFDSHILRFSARLVIDGKVDVKRKFVVAYFLSDDNILVTLVPEENSGTYLLWQYGLWSFQSGYIKLQRFLPKNQHTQRKFLNFENWTNGEPQ